MTIVGMMVAGDVEERIDVHGQYFSTDSAKSGVNLISGFLQELGH